MLRGGPAVGRCQVSAAWTRDQFAAWLDQMYGPEAPGVLEQVSRWIARGDGAAVYVNQDLGHPDVGYPQIASFGSPAAQLETDEPPEQLPDIGGSINWRYRLEATYREARE